MLRLKTAMREVQQLLQNPMLDEDEEMVDESFQGVPAEPSAPVDTEAEEEEPAMGSQPLPAAWAPVARREDQIHTAVRRADLLDDVPVAMKKARTDKDQSVFMMKRCVSAKGREKQLEKELPWGMIPQDERHLFRQAEATQWKEHVDFGAVRPLSVEESRQVLATVSPERILRSRFAYKDKNYSRRKTDASIPCRPKARLCIAGHQDPDLGRYG